MILLVEYLPMQIYPEMYLELIHFNGGRMTYVSLKWVLGKIMKQQLNLV